MLRKGPDMALGLADREVINQRLDSVVPEVFPDPNIPCLCDIWDGKWQFGGLAEAAGSTSDTRGQHGHSSMGSVGPAMCPASAACRACHSPGTATARAAQTALCPGKESS